MSHFRAITKESLHKNDVKPISIDGTWENHGANLKKKTEFYCKLHARDRLLNLCHQNTLVDVVLSGTMLHFEPCDSENTSCRECDMPAEIRIDRQ